MFKECTFSNPALMAYELFSLLSQFLLEFLFTSWLNRVKLVLVSCKISLVLCDPTTDFMLVGRLEGNYLMQIPFHSRGTRRLQTTPCTQFPESGQKKRGMFIVDSTNKVKHH